MAIVKKFLNIFKSGSQEDEEARLNAQRERYDSFLKALTSGDLDTRWNAVPVGGGSRGALHRAAHQRSCGTNTGLSAGDRQIPLGRSAPQPLSP